jgi:NAD-dependent DNA ligase
MTPDLQTYLRAHQYLYYILGTPVLTDHEFDMWGRDNDLDYKGGSDCADDYSQDEKDLASDILRNLCPRLP